MKTNQNQKIIKAVKANRGGLANATESQIMIIWRSLDKPTQTQYLESVKLTEKAKAEGAK